MAGSNTHTTVSNLEKGRKKQATKLYEAFKSKVPELGWLDDIEDEEITPSGRENLIPLDVTRGYGAHMVSDGGNEARTVTPGLQEGSFSFVHMNGRFFISLFAQALDAKSRGDHFKTQLKYQSKKTLEGMARRVGLQTYGFSTGYVAQVNENEGSGTASVTYTLDNAFGDADIDTGAYITSLFDPGDRVGLVASGALVTNALGVVDSVTAATPSITVTWDGAVDSADNDYVVFANAVTDATITATDYNKWPIGLLDITTSTSLHGLSGSTYAAWNAARNSTAGGRYGRAMLKSDKQAISNASGGKITDVVMSQGVENDMEAGEAAARIYSSSKFDLDQEVTAKGVQFHTSELVPPGHVFAFDRSGWGKKLLTEMLEEGSSLSWGDLYKAEDRSGYKGGYDFMYARVCRSRGKFVRRALLTEQ